MGWFAPFYGDKHTAPVTVGRITSGGCTFASAVGCGENAPVGIKAFGDEFLLRDISGAAHALQPGRSIAGRWRLS
jgi:hypothetical protein